MPAGGTGPRGREIYCQPPGPRARGEMRFIFPTQLARTATHRDPERLHCLPARLMHILQFRGILLELTFEATSQLPTIFDRTSSRTYEFSSNELHISTCRPLNAKAYWWGLDSYRRVSILGEAATCVQRRRFLIRESGGHPNCNPYCTRSKPGNHISA